MHRHSFRYLQFKVMSFEYDSALKMMHHTLQIPIQSRKRFVNQTSVYLKSCTHGKLLCLKTTLKICVTFMR